MKFVYLALALSMTFLANDQSSASSSGSITDTLRKEGDRALDLIILVRTEGFRSFDQQRAPFGTDIDGNITLERTSGDLMLNNCFTLDLTNSAGDLASQIFDRVNKADHQYLAINTLYQTRGVANLTTVVNTVVEQWLENKQSKLTIRKSCRDGRPTAMSYTNEDTSELTLIPRFMLEYAYATVELSGLRKHRVLREIPFAELRVMAAQASQQAQAVVDARESLNGEYERLAAADSLDSVGSLVLNRNADGNKVQSFCTLEYAGDKALNVLGYRLSTDQMLPQDLQREFDRDGFSLGQSTLRFAQTFDDINAAFRAISREPNACNIFVDHPANLLRLKNALIRQGFKADFANLRTTSDMQDRYSLSQGFRSRIEMDFAASIGASSEQLQIMRRFAITEIDAYQKVVREIRQTGYTKDEPTIASILSFLEDRESAVAQNIDVVSVRDARLAAEQRQKAADAARRARERAELIKNYPFEATLSCGFQGQHINIAACFAGSRTDPQTTLELTNGSQYGLFDATNINSIGSETNQGLVIDLRNTFNFRAQNSSARLQLRLVVRNRESGAIIFERAVTQFGVLTVSNGM